jgi:hypothetical protein
MVCERWKMLTHHLRAFRRVTTQEMWARCPLRRLRHMGFPARGNPSISVPSKKRGA